MDKTAEKPKNGRIDINKLFDILKREGEQLIASNKTLAQVHQEIKKVVDHK